MAKPNRSRFPLSYSKVTCFEQCPHKFERIYVEKSVSDDGNEATWYGHRVHKSLELYGRTRDPGQLTEETRQWKGLVDKILSTPGEKLFEHKIAIDPAGIRVEWMDPEVWVRMVADVLIIDGDTAYYIDWKTGKVKPDTSQLRMSAAIIFMTMPQIKKVKALFAWLRFNQTTPAEFAREDLYTIWRSFLLRFDKVQDAVDMGLFPGKTGPLCNWCPAKKMCIYI